jgi:hypothetical protein
VLVVSCESLKNNQHEHDIQGGNAAEEERVDEQENDDDDVKKKRPGKILPLLTQSSLVL